MIHDGSRWQSDFFHVIMIQFYLKKIADCSNRCGVIFVMREVERLSAHLDHIIIFKKTLTHLIINNNNGRVYSRDVCNYDEMMLV